MGPESQFSRESAEVTSRAVLPKFSTMGAAGAMAALPKPANAAHPYPNF